jgi:acyl carrier protein
MNARRMRRGLPLRATRLNRRWPDLVQDLKVKRIGIHDNFFELGGHSLLAVRIMAEIERLLQRKLPLATFLQAPTIGDLADVLRKEDWKPSWSSLVPIRAGGSKPPLFLMHSHGGNVLEYYPLAERLDADQPVYALQARGLDGHIIKDQSFEEMVEAYVAELRSLQPEGPYFLGGYCLGGLLALEAARQLSALGEEVALVVLIQTINPAYARFRPGLSATAARLVSCDEAHRPRVGISSLSRGNHIVERGIRT